MGLFKTRSTIAALQTIAERLQNNMADIKQMLPAGAKLTLVIRSDRFDKPIILTNDEQADVLAAVREMLPGQGLVVTSH